MNILDTRDLYKRKCELESARDDWESAKDDALEALTDAGLDPDKLPEDPDKDQAELIEAWEEAQKEPYDFGEDEKTELAELEDLENEISGFMHGVALIPESDFEDYAREYAEEVGAIDRDMAWPANCIDWEAAATELQQDYSSVSFQGTDYLFRS